MPSKPALSASMSRHGRAPCPSPSPDPRDESWPPWGTGEGQGSARRGATRPVAWVADRGHACLLPLVSWAHQGARPHCRRRTAKRQEALGEGRVAVDRQALSQRLAPQGLVDGQAEATDRVNTLPRVSSAVEGCNGSLAHMHHHHRGLPKHRDKGWTVLHHCAGRASDGTMLAAQFFQRPLPDLLATA
jgi:hypothetical protein